MSTSALAPSTLDLARTVFEHADFTSAGLPDVYGRCAAGCTLFVELDDAQKQIRAWILDVESMEYLGKTYVVAGLDEAAARQALHLLESNYAQDRLSGGLERYSRQVCEAV